MSADQQDAAVPVPERSPRGTSPAYFERRQTRELLELHIGIPAILEALEFAISSEPDQDDQGQPLPPSKFRQMYDHMLDPSMSSLPDHSGRVRYPIDTVMARYKIKLPELLSLIGVRNLGMAITKSGSRLDKVIDGLGEAAEPHIYPCPKCDGEGYLPGLDDEPAEECERCAGRGEIRKFADPKYIEMFLGLHGAPNAKGGTPSSGIRDINLAVSAQASAKSGQPSKDADPINVRIQRLIEG